MAQPFLAVLLGSFLRRVRSFSAFLHVALAFKPALLGLPSSGGRNFSSPLESKGPGANHPKTILPPIPFSALTHAPVISTGMNDPSRFSLRDWSTLSLLA